VLDGLLLNGDERLEYLQVSLYLSTILAVERHVSAKQIVSVDGEDGDLRIDFYRHSRSARSFERPDAV